MSTQVATTDGSATSSELETNEAVFASFNFDHLMWAGLPLAPDLRAVLFSYAPGSNAMVPTLLRVVEREEVTLPGGERRQAWVVERPIQQPDDARMHHFRILEEPPYLHSRHLVDLETAETSFHVELLEWQLLDER